VSPSRGPTDERWPELPWEAWKDTAATLHMWTQIVGKVRLAQSPWTNHSWHVTLYVTPRGLTTSPIPYARRSFQIDFDFIGHRLLIATSDGESRGLDLKPRATADFYAALMAALRELDLQVNIHGRPNEVEHAVPFAEDREHASYDRDAVDRFRRVLVQVDRVFKDFRARFIGKCSPVHFFWGSFDLAVTRFSGRPAPPHPGGFPNLPDRVTREAYSHEVSSAGFWPGGPGVPRPIFFSYAYPSPEGFSDVEVRPSEAGWNTDMREFVLDYDAVRRAPSPDAALMEFLQTTYEGAARQAGWDRAALERTFEPRGR
jgi:Family of unknown function (DUF5996)